MPPSCQLFVIASSAAPVCYAFAQNTEQAMQSMLDEVIPIFPTPIYRSRGLIESRLIAALVAHFTALATDPNKSSTHLAHTRMLQPGESPLFVESAGRITPKLAEFGLELFGERLPWSLKEMWVNVLDTG